MKPVACMGGTDLEYYRADGMSGLRQNRTLSFVIGHLHLAAFQMASVRMRDK
jgi:hypothetical protein